jgi:oligosaccharide repeat unit polymerase
MLWDSYILAIVLFFVFIIIFGIILIKRFMNQSFDLAEPGIWFALFFFAHFGVRALWDIKFGSPMLNLDPFDSSFGTVNSALAVSILAFLIFWFAYSRNLGKKIAQFIPELPREWNVSFILPVAFFCVLVGWGVRLYLIISQAANIKKWIISGTDQYLAQAAGVSYLQHISSLATIAVFLLFIGGRVYQKQSYKWFSYILLIPELAFSFLTGKRSYMSFLLLSFLIALYMTTQRDYKTSLRLVRWALIILLLLVILFPLISYVRFQGFQNLNKALESYESLLSVFEKTGTRLHDLDSLALIMEKVPEEEPYTLGKEFWLLSVAWIPRRIWPQKPAISLGEIFREKMVPPDVFPEGASVSVSFPGQFYWDLGIAGVIVGMILVGILWRVLYEYLVKPKGNISNSLVTAFMFTSFFLPLEQTLVSTFTGHLFKFFVILLVILALSWSGKRILGGNI